MLVTLLVILLLITSDEVDARSKRKIKRGLKNVGTRPQEQSMMKALSIIKNTFLIVLAPVTLMFLYSVVTDPATPRIARALWKMINRKFLGTLSSSNNDTNRNDTHALSKLSDLERRTFQRSKSAALRARCMPQRSLGEMRES